MKNKELLGLIEDTKNTCINMVTGVDFKYEKYEAARQDILSKSELKSVVPDWLIDNRYGSQFWQFMKQQSSTYEGRRIFLRSAFDGMADHIKSGGNQPTALSVRDKLGAINNTEINRLWRKSQERMQNDPAGVVTAAKSLLEATMKYILDEEGVTYSKQDDMTELYKKTKKVLNLDPANHNIDTFKQILGGVTSVVQGFSNLRNEYGDAHGKGSDSFNPEARHAELALNLSGALCVFLVDTYKKDKETT
jgi:hypothetical protein